MPFTNLSMEGSHGNNGWIPYDIGVMIIDEDPLSLLFVHTMLATCHYRVVSFSNPADALHEICKKRAEFDLVIVDLHMVSMPGFSFVEHITKGLKLPVITTCADEESDLLHQALNCGACFHLVKPITVNNMEFVWKKSWRNRVNGPLEPLRLMKFHNVADAIVSQGKRPLQIGSSSSFKFARYEPDYTGMQGFLRERDGGSDSEDHSKPRLQWDCELHKRFLIAISLLGADAVPSSIIGIMNVAGLTTKQVASHLQKHRKRLLKEKQNKERENLLTNVVTAQKFPTCLASTSSQKPNDLSLLMSNQMNQETMQHQSSSSVVRRSPFVLPKPRPPTANGSELSTILQQHSSSFQDTPPNYPFSNQWFDIPNDTIGNASAERSTLLQNWTGQVHGFTQSSQTSRPSILRESFTDLINSDSYTNISQFMNFDFNPFENNINMGTTENYDVAFSSNLDEPLQTGSSLYGKLDDLLQTGSSLYGNSDDYLQTRSSLYGNLDDHLQTRSCLYGNLDDHLQTRSSLYGNLESTMHKAMKEPVISDAANEWPGVDEFLGCNNELQLASQKDLVVPGTSTSTNFNFDSGCDFNNFRDSNFDYAFLAEILNDIDKGGTA